MSNLTLSDLPDEFANYLIKKKSDSIFLIMNRERTNVVKNPGMDAPYHTENYKIAEEMAKRVGNGAFVCTLGDAIKHLTSVRLAHHLNTDRR